MISKTVNKTWYISEDVPGGSGAVVELNWNSADELPSFDHNLCFVSHYKNNRWDPTAASGATGGDPYSKRRGSITSFSPFAVTNSDGPLPVTLSRFDTVREGNTALLSWSTASETNSVHFEVERSMDGKDWESLGSVRSMGDSKGAVDYHFVDLHPFLSQENLYRLRMVDADGTFAYSRIRSLKFDADAPVVFPNPANDKLFVQDFTRVSSLRINDMNRKVVHQSGAMKNNEISVNKLTTGVYFIEIRWLDGRKIVLNPYVVFQRPAT